MNPADKIIQIFCESDIPKTIDEKVVICYGHFNVIHPGHIRYLQYAKSLGKKLKVILFSGQYLDKFQRKKFFNEFDRAHGLASLHIVDVVYILNTVSLSTLILRTKPSILVLGKEFEKSRRKDIQELINTIEVIGSRVYFHAGDIQYTSSEFLHSNLQEIEQERRSLFFQVCKRQKLELKNLVERIHKFSNANILVVGDTIVDQYVACDPIGMSAEAPVLVVKELEAREFVGGAAIVASHVRELGARCKFLSVVGVDSNAEFVKRELEQRNIETLLIQDETRPTTFKIRYIL